MQEHWEFGAHLFSFQKATEGRHNKVHGFIRMDIPFKDFVIEKIKETDKGIFCDVSTKRSENEGVCTKSVQD